MLILHILNSNKFSGAENVVCQIIKQTNKTKKIDSIYVSMDGPIRDVLEEKNIKFETIKKISIKEIRRIYKKYKPDIIHAHDFRASIICAFSNVKCKIISQIHQTPKFISSWNIKSNMYFLSTKKINKIIGVSESIEKNMVFMKHIKDKYITISNCVNQEEIKRLSSEYNIDQKYDLAFFGRLEKVKGPLHFIKIIKELRKKEKNIKAVMIGDGCLKNDCIEKINKLGLEKNIQIIGHLNNPFPVLKQCKIVTITSEWEGLPMSVLECLCLKIPVLNNGVGELKEVFKTMPYLIAYNDENYISKTIELLKNKEKYEDIKSEIEKITKKYCNLEEWARKYENIYLNV